MAVRQGGRSAFDLDRFSDGALEGSDMTSDLEAHEPGTPADPPSPLDRQFQTLAEALPQIVWLADVDCSFTYLNRKWSEVTGLTLDESSGHGWQRAFHPDDVPEILNQWERAVRCNAPCELTFRLRSGDGVYRRFQGRAEPLLDDDHRPVGWFAVCGECDATRNERAGTTLDVTGSRTATGAVISSEKYFRRVLDSLFTFVGVMTPDGTLIEANRAPLEAAAVSPEEVLGRPAWDTYWFNHSPEVQAQLKEAVARANLGEASRYDVDVRMAGGVLMTIDFMLAPLRDETGQIQFLIPSAVDISERNRAEKGLRMHNERLRLLWETAGILFSTDNSAAMIQGLFEKISDHLKVDTCFHYMVNEQADALRLQFAAGVSADDASSLARLKFGQAICGTVAETRRPAVATSIQQTDDPRTRVLKTLGIRSFVCNPLIANGQLLGTLSFGSRSRDRFNDDELEFVETITNYVTVAYERMRLLSQLHDRDRRKDEFLAMLAHELRNPLAPIRNAVQYLRVQGLEEQDIGWARDMIDRQVTNLVHLIDDLLEISRITRGKIQLHSKHVRLSEILAHAVEAMQPAISEKHHILSVDFSNDPLPVFGDATRLEQILVNLLGNAVKYTDEGGMIDVNARRDGDRAVIQVRDNGIGIPREMLRQIFEPFTQVDQSLDRSKGGLGIGLTLVKSLVEMHGGGVLADSEGVGQGSQFTLWLPLVEEAARLTPRAQKLATVTADRPPARILVVEDNTDAADGIAMLLSTCGFDVKIAHNGKSAISLAREFQPEVILLDIGLPGMNGYDVVGAFREFPELRDVRLIAVSGYGQETDQIRSREAGFEHHFVKPVDFESLKAHLYRVPS